MKNRQFYRDVGGVLSKIPFFLFFFLSLNYISIHVDGYGGAIGF